MSSRAVGRLPRLVWYLWAFPTTLVGLVVLAGAVLTGARVRGVAGVLEVHGGLATWLLRRAGARAMTLGHVVIALDEPDHDFCRAHERVHVRQCERWGPLFLPAYAAASVAAWVRGGRCYYDNRFEREARRVTGGKGRNGSDRC